jgi:putative phage-type endonuclease
MNVKERQKRQKGIGGSDVAAICGFNPWATALDVYYSKIIPIKDNDKQINDNQERLDAGTRAEEFIIKSYEDMCGCRVKTNFPLFHHPQYPFLIGNVDGIREDENIVVECKTVGGYPDQWQGQIPIYYKTQCAHYAMLTDCDRVDLVACFDRWQIKVFFYERDVRFEDGLIKVCVDFWNNNVLKKIAPQPQSLKDFARTRYKHNSICEANASIINVLEAYKSALERQKLLEKEVDKLKVKILDHMKDNDTLVDIEGNPLLTYRETVQNRLDTKALKENEPETYKKYAKESSYRKLKMAQGAKNGQGQSTRSKKCI